ncbi:hypothetical protein BDZ91DRAFT_731726 [Kalaharituber pfeilii]|nr:hypothetical protein BDZ91DRAFT_731726 [Kalaharituber pfeilii]
MENVGGRQINMQEVEISIGSGLASSAGGASLNSAEFESLSPPMQQEAIPMGVTPQSISTLGATTSPQVGGGASNVLPGPVPEAEIEVAFENVGAPVPAQGAQERPLQAAGIPHLNPAGAPSAPHAPAHGGVASQSVPGAGLHAAGAPLNEPETVAVESVGEPGLAPPKPHAPLQYEGSSCKNGISKGVISAVAFFAAVVVMA